jgi:hypothetical protein
MSQEEMATNTDKPGLAETASEEAAASGSEEEEKQSTEEQTNDQPENKDGKIKRISTLSFRLRESQRREQQLQEENIQLREQANAKPEPVSDADAPKPEDFDSDIDFLRAQMKHDLKVAVAEMKSEELRKTQTVNEQREELELKKKFAEKVEAAFDKHGDRFEEAIHDVEYSPLMTKHIAPSEVMDDIAMYLLDNPKEADAIRAMSEPQLIRTLTLLEHNIKTATSSSEQRTKAPQPPTGVKSTKSPSNLADYSKMTGDEYQKRRDKERHDKAMAGRK